MEEVWKRIPGFSRYEASTFGRIKSYARPHARPFSRPRIIYGHFVSEYLRITIISDEDKTKSRFIHHLIFGNIYWTKTISRI